MKGESPLWGVLMSAVGASFVVVTVALVLVSKRADDEAASATASPDSAHAASSLPTDGGAPTDASTAPEPVVTDAGADASIAPAAPEPSAVAASAPVKPKSPTPTKKTPVKPRPKKPR